MRALVLTLDKVLSVLVVGAMSISAVCVVGMIAVNTVDTVGRALFSKPMLGALEITEVLLAACIILAIPYAQRHREHIEIDIFKRMFGPRLAKVSTVVMLVITILVFAMLTQQSYESALESVANFEVSAGYVRVPVWLGKIAVVIGFAIALLVAVWQLLGALTGVDDSAPPPVPTSA